MDETAQALLEIFNDSFSTFLRDETDNILSGINERNLCCRLSIILNERIRNTEFTNYYVDVEYNRMRNGELKTIIDDDHHIIRINCDIIIHSRGESVQDDNLIAIEIKKSSRREDEKESDRRRLRTLTKVSFDDVWSNDGTTHPEHVCGYKLGMYIELNSINRNCLVEYYLESEKIDERTEDF